MACNTSHRVLLLGLCPCGRPGISGAYFSKAINTQGVEMQTVSCIGFDTWLYCLRGKLIMNYIVNSFLYDVLSSASDDSCHNIFLLFIIMPPFGPLICFMLYKAAY